MYSLQIKLLCLVTSLLAMSTAPAFASPSAPHSSLIKSMVWHWPTGFNQQNGSDLWPATWGADGNVYVAFGDGGGFLGSDSLGRTSFGIGMITGSDPVITADNASNIFGGLHAAHRSTINGKIGSLIAVGSNFYGVGGIYRPGDPKGPSGAPNHSEIVYSIGDAYSWQDAHCTFCSADSKGNPTSGVFCPGGFVNFGRGNAGAPDNFVYLYGTDNSKNYWVGTNATGPAYTYLLRVPGNQVTTLSAYQCVAGFDTAGKPLWDSDLSHRKPIFTDQNAKPMSIGEAFYNAGIHRYIGVAQGVYVNQAAFYEAPNPWGPWKTIAYYNSNADNTGGWGNLGSSAFTVGHGDSLGIHFINAWTSKDGLTMWATFSSDGNAPADADLAPLAGKDMDSISLVEVTLVK